MPLPLTLGPSRALLTGDPFAGPRAGLVSLWHLEEASGTRSDSRGTSPLTSNNSVGTTTGKVGQAAQCVAASSQSLSAADSAALSTGDIDFTWAMWVWLDSVGTARTIVSKGQTATAQFNAYFLRYSSAANRFRWSVGNGTTTAGQVDANTLGAPSTGQWYFLVAWHDSVADTVNLQGNNGTVDSAAYSGGSYDNTALLGIGAADNADSTFWDGRLDEVAFWKRILTAGERTQLYNGGAGVRL